MPFQTISERAFDGLNNLERLNLENNRLKMLERGLFTAMPALTYLNLMRNSLETVTLHTIQPLMNNLVNHTTSMLLIKGNFSNFAGSSIKSPPCHPLESSSRKKSLFSILIIFWSKQFLSMKSSRISNYCLFAAFSRKISAQRKKRPSTPQLIMTTIDEA